jgi:hypothetical protein
LTLGGPPAAGRERALVVGSQQGEHLEHGSVAVEGDGHPTRVRAPPVLTGRARGDQPIAERTRQRQVGAAVTVQVSELSALDVQRDPPEAVGPSVHAGPTERFRDDMRAAGQGRSTLACAVSRDASFVEKLPLGTSTGQWPQM